MLSDKKLVLLILLASSLISCTLFFGRIDHDFFSWYYVGRGLAQGADIYRDFSGNKGPLLYLFFEFLYVLFHQNYKLGLVLSSTFFDTISIYFLLKIIKDVYRVSFVRSSLTFFIIIAAVAVYKSFSISAALGGIYSESLGGTFFIIAYWLQRQKKQPLLTGALFAIAVCTRQTYLFFLPVFLTELLISKQNARTWISFFGGFLLLPFSFIIYFFLGNTLSYMFYNTVSTNLQYAQAVKNSSLISLIGTIESNLPIFFILTSVIAFTCWYFFSTKTKERYRLIIFLLCSLKAIFPGDIFYVHHFTQFMPIFFVAIAVAAHRLSKTYSSPIFTTLGALVLCFTLLNYWRFTLTSSIKPPPEYQTGPKKYVMVMTYYPEYYTLYDTYAPDKYLTSIALNPSFNAQSRIDIDRHKSLSKKRVQQTAFLTIINNAYDRQMTDNYLKEFKEPFKLEKVSSKTDGGTKMELYYSKL